MAITENTTAVQRLWGLIKANRKEVSKIYWLAFYSGLISLSLPFGIQAIINFIQGSTYSVSYYVLVLLITLAVIIYSVLQQVELRILEDIQQKIFTYAGIEFTFRFPRIKIEHLLSTNARDLANRFFDSIVLEKSIIKLLTDFSISFMQILISALVLCFYHESFILLNIIILSVLYFGFKWTFSKTLKTGIDYSKEKYKVAYWIEEVANASSTFKLAGKTNLPLKRTDEILVEYLTTRNQHYRWLNIQYTFLNISKILYVLGFLLIGGIMVMEQKMNIGQFVAAEVLILTIINGIDKIMNTLKSVYDTFIALEKIAEVTDIPLEENKSETYFTENTEGMSVHLINVQFKYSRDTNQRNILHNINMHIKNKEKVLITGKNNSGKTSLIKVISSLYDITDGDIKYNGISVKDIDKEKLRYDIGIYFQEDVIFNGTVWENITLGRVSVDEQFVHTLAKKISLSNELSLFPNGYQTTIHAHGAGLPLSVIHKILFLRIVATKPKLLLMENIHQNFFKDERENFIQILTDKNAPWTLICVDDLDNFARYYDTIYELSAGEIIKQGTYHDFFRT